MLRADANAYLVEEYRELATEAEFTSDQTTSAYSVAMDMSLRQLGYAEAALSTADVLKYLALLNYYALNRFAKLLSIRVDTAAGNNAINTKDSQAFDQVTKLQARAAQEVASYGIDVGGIGAYRMGRINLDFLEPSTTTEF
jgi:hypothetical protein